MKKIIKQWGDSKVLTFSSEDCKIYGIETGDVVEVHIRKTEEEEDESKV